MPDLLSLPSGAPCIPNIGPLERRNRMRAGVVSFVVSLGILAALAATGAAWWWRLLLFVPFFTATTGFFQARDKT